VAKTIEQIANGIGAGSAKLKNTLKDAKCK